MAVRINPTAVATSKSAGFHAARIEGGKLVADYYGHTDYSCVLRPDGHGFLLIGPGELSASHSLIYDVDEGGVAIRNFPTAGKFTKKAMKFIQSLEALSARAAEKRELAGA